MFILAFQGFCVVLLSGHSAHDGYTGILDRNCHPVALMWNFSIALWQLIEM